MLFREGQLFNFEFEILNFEFTKIPPKTTIHDRTNE